MLPVVCEYAAGLNYIFQISALLVSGNELNLPLTCWLLLAQDRHGCFPCFSVKRGWMWNVIQTWTGDKKTVLAANYLLSVCQD